jgi:outer membrane protein assembly factor BamA
VKKISIDVHGQVPLPNFIWDLGFSYFDISTLPKKMPKFSNQPTLFEKYINSGAIPQNQKDGGVVLYYKLGLIYDTRDNESIPTKGFWIQAIYTGAPAFLSNKFPYSMATFKFHHYISLHPKLVFTYRLSYQMKMNGNIPFYMLPYFIDSYQVQDALGGSKTIRGVLARRLIGNGFALANAELRYIPFSTILFDRNLSIGFNLFEDIGIVTDKYDVNKAIDSSTFDYKPGLEKLHHGVGFGTRFIINHNFIVALDYGMALDKRDGNNSFYLDLDYLF